MITQGTVTNANNTNYDITFTNGVLTINRKTLTATASASNKVYDGTTTATATLTLSGLVGAETLGQSVGATFADKNVANAKTVTVNSITLSDGDSGGLASNYSISTGQTTTANITAKALTIAGITASNKTYNGNTTATIDASAATFTGLVDGDDVTVSATGTFDNKNVGTNKTVTLTETNAGDDVGNYSITDQGSTTANITAKALTATASASNKVYDGTTTATATLTLSGLVGAETLGQSVGATFADKNVANAKTVTVNSITLSDGDSGGLASNYSISTGQTTTANITAKALTIAVLLQVTKHTMEPYQPLPTDSGATFTGLVRWSADDVTVSSTGTFDNKNVGVGKTVTLVETTGGDDVGNYNITDQGSTTANITAKVLTINSELTSASKVYDGTRTAVVDRSDLFGLIEGEDVTATGGGTYDDANVGTGKTITISYTLEDGVTAGLASNYSIGTQSTDNGIITKAPLTVTAIDDAKFVTESDPTFTYVYNGFVNGETADDLVTAGKFIVGNITRSNNLINAAGTYTDVLVPSSFNADNYDINTISGDFTIVPADQLIFKITAVSNLSYANNPIYDNTSGTHHYTARYLDSASNDIVNLTENVLTSDNNVIINDNNGTTVVFDINAKDGSLSNSNNLIVGGYNLEATNTTITGTNFNSLIVSGSLTVDPVNVDVTNTDHISVSSITKTYDGSATISSVPIAFDEANSIIELGDLVTVTASGTYNTRHVGSGKATIIDVALSGADSANYALIDAEGNANTRITDNVGIITQLESVSWTGDLTGGEWSNAANWAGGAIPDQENVATAIIPIGYSVIYNSDTVGQISNTTIQNNGVVEFNGSTAFEFDSVVTGTGNLKHSGDGILTISGDNTFSGSLNITDKEVSLTHNNALGTGNSIISNSGTLSVGSDITLPSLTTTGAITIKTNITTTGAQIYNDDVTINSDNTLETIDYDNFAQTGEDGEIIETTLSSGDEGYVSKDWKIFSTSNANITFGGKLKASTGSKDNKTSLILQTCNTEICTGGEVTFEDKVGYEFIDTDMSATDGNRASSGTYSNLIGHNKDNFYRLDVKAQTININANIMTWEEQVYRSPVLVGSNDDDLVKYAISIDPAITFLSTVGDSNDDGTHSLVVRAIKLPGVAVDPNINFNIENIQNLGLFDPYAFSLLNDDALSLNFGDFGSLGSLSGSVAGYTQSGVIRNQDYIISYSPPSVSLPTSSSSDALVDVFKSLMEAGNKGSILDFFKNLGGTSGQNRTFVKSIEVLSGSEIQSECVADPDINFETNADC